MQRQHQNFSLWNTRLVLLTCDWENFYHLLNVFANRPVILFCCCVLVHSSDSTRVDLTIPGEQYFYLRAINAAERQKWLVALGTAKACLTDNRTKREKGTWMDTMLSSIYTFNSCCRVLWMSSPMLCCSFLRAPGEHRGTENKDVRAQIVLWPSSTTSKQDQGERWGWRLSRGEVNIWMS